MGDAERNKQLIAEKAYNQCSITIRVDGDEIEIPIDFGHTADEIRKIYPFLLPLVQEKIKNPAIEFGEKVKQGAFDDYTDEEYNKVVLNMKEQSKYWYDKQEASVLELAMRFALDIKLRNFDDLIYIFSPIERLEAIKSSELTEEETKQVVRDMKLESNESLEKDAGEHNVKADAASGHLSFNIYGSDVSDEKYNDTLDNMEKQIVSDEVFKAIVENDSKEINTERYKSTYKPGPYEESLVKDGRVDIYTDDSEEEEKDNEPVFTSGNDNDIVEDIDSEVDSEDSEFDDDFGPDDNDFDSEDEFDEEVPEDDFADEDIPDDAISDVDDMLDGEEDEFDEDDDNKKDDEE